MMAEKIDEIEIDLSRVDLYGHDSCLGELNCKVLSFAMITDKCVLPRVDVVFNNGVYQLVYGEKVFNYENYGGHSRSRVALDNMLSLRCNLWDNHPVKPFGSYPEKKWVKIDDIELREFRNSFRLNRVERNLFYLSKRSSQRFMRESDLFLDNDGFLVAREDYGNIPSF